jgi:hypothetical protein
LLRWAKLVADAIAAKMMITVAAAERTLLIFPSPETVSARRIVLPILNPVAVFWSGTL